MSLSLGGSSSGSSICGVCVCVCVCVCTRAHACMSVCVNVLCPSLCCSMEWCPMPTFCRLLAVLFALLAVVAQAYGCCHFLHWLLCQLVRTWLTTLFQCRCYNSTMRCVSNSLLTLAWVVGSFVLLSVKPCHCFSGRLFGKVPNQTLGKVNLSTSFLLSPLHYWVCFDIAGLQADTVLAVPQTIISCSKGSGQEAFSVLSDALTWLMKLSPGQSPTEENLSSFFAPLFIFFSSLSGLKECFFIFIFFLIKTIFLLLPPAPLLSLVRRVYLVHCWGALWATFNKLGSWYIQGRSWEIYKILSGDSRLARL